MLEKPRVLGAKVAAARRDLTLQSYAFSSNPKAFFSHKKKRTTPLAIYPCPLANRLLALRDNIDFTQTKFQHFTACRFFVPAE
jgi:hypothetical protein